MTITGVDITGEFRLNCVQVAIMRLRYFTVYLGHNQYAELKMNPNYTHHIHCINGQPKLLFGKVFVCLVEESNYYHFTTGQNNL